MQALGRIALSILPNLSLGLAGYRARAFSASGMVAGATLGTLITYALGPGGFLVVLSFVAAGTATTRIGFSRKHARGISEPRGGRRTWMNAVANLGVSALASLAHTLGPSQILALFATASVATAACDTVASEVGKAFAGKSLTLHDLRIRDAGAPGGVSLVGTLSGCAASLATAVVGAAFGLLTVPAVPYVVVAALVATLAESLAKSLLGLKSAHVGNLLNTSLGGLIAVLLASLP